MAHLGLVLEDDLLAAPEITRDPGSHHGAGNGWLTDQSPFVVPNQQNAVEIDCLAFFDRQSVDLNDFAQADFILSPAGCDDRVHQVTSRSEEHTSELQSRQ